MSSVIMLTLGIYPPNAGDALYNWGIYRELKKIVDIKVFSLTMDKKESKDEDIYFYRSQKVYGGFNRKMFSDICRYIAAKNVDLILISHVMMYRYLRPIKRKYPSIDIIYVSHNVEYLNDIMRYKNELRNKKGLKKLAYFLGLRKRIKGSKKREKMMLTETTAYFSISRSDIAMHKKIYGKTAPSYFLKPIIPFPCNKSKEDLEIFQKRLLIVGSMSWYPNVNGTIWFVKEVMDQLFHEGYILYIVGSDPQRSIIDLAVKWPDNIVVTGKVPTVDDHFRMCDISIVPIFEGTGAKIKVLESIGRGIPTISTSFAAKDYDIHDEILIADTAQEFIDRIHLLEQNASYRKELYEKMKIYYQRYNQMDPEICAIFK